MNDYGQLLEYADGPEEKARIAACMTLPTQKAAAEHLGIDQRTLERTLARIRDRHIKYSMGKRFRTHCMIPDTQVTPDTPQDHLGWIAEYLKDKQPDVIVHIGDHADMESLSSYDEGKKSAEGRRVIADFDAANKAMKRLTKPITDTYNPELHITLGNHEYRIVRACEDDAKLDGFLSLDNLNYADLGWKVHDFLTEVEVDGVRYAHYFPNPMSGKPWGGMIETMIKNIGYSFSMGHKQMHKHDRRPLGNGKILNGLISGACYLHNEDYKGKAGNVHWRGIVMKHEVFNGSYDIMEVSLDYLCRQYEEMPLHIFMAKKYPEIARDSEYIRNQAMKYA